MAKEKTLKEDLLAIVKGEGLSVAEDTIANLAKTAFKILRVAIPKVNAAVGLIVVPLIDLVEPSVMAAIDKIDGEDDEGR